jgi:signal recognition particle subunit SRP54
MSEFTLNEFRRLLDRTTRLLPPGVFSGVIPGLGIRSEAVGNSEVKEQIRRICGIIDSMTTAERSRPAIIDQARLQRISRGSGAALLEVSDLLHQYEALNRIMKSIRKPRR